MDSRITKTHGLFGHVCRVEVNIHATRERVWMFLTHMEGMPTRATVTESVPNDHLTWTSGTAPVFRDVRDFRLRPRADGTTDLTIEERISGLLAPPLEGTDHAPMFARYAEDVKRAAEQV